MRDLDASYRRLFPILQAHAKRVLGDTAAAEDVAQETFIRLWQAHRADDPPQKLLAWSYTTSTRLCIDRLRRRKVRSDAPLPTPPPASQVHLQLVLHELERNTPEDHLTAVLLHRVDGVPQEVVAQQLGCTPRTLRRWLASFDERHAEATS